MSSFVKENTRFIGNDSTARLDLQLTKELDATESVKYPCLMHENDHIVLRL